MSKQMLELADEIAYGLATEGKHTLFREGGEVVVAALRLSADSVQPNPLGFFSQNVDAWGAAEWFDRLAKAVRGRNAAVVAKDDLQFETCNNVASSSASRLVMDFEAQVRAALRTAPQTALMVLARNALQAARDALRPYAKIDYDVDNQPQPNNAFDVDQICREALYEIDVAEPIIRCADCPSRYLNGGCSGCPEDAPLAVERSQAGIAQLAVIDPDPLDRLEQAFIELTERFQKLPRPPSDRIDTLQYCVGAIRDVRVSLSRPVRAQHVVLGSDVDDGQRGKERD